jgi:hypothetical protein
MHGVKDARADPALIRNWWQNYPRANVGLAAGVAWWALDVDGQQGRETLKELCRQHGQLPAAPIAVTGSGGLHLFFALPSGRTVRNSVRRLGPGLDTRALGGYIVAPPSLHASGRHYRWAKGRSPDEVELAPAPAWLAEMLDPPAPVRPRIAIPADIKGTTAYATAALQRELRRVVKALPGDDAGRGRNHSLYIASRSLGELCGAGLLDSGAVAASLAAVALATGLGRLEVERTLASGLRAGLAKPREVRRG